ncbi:MAG: hypothetical protein APR53_04220 [Methanoculleus sp. SDB]|nr:MAG: hypothetical protein APR53_04220 [Methanoculleus sp. SDB]
MMRQILTVMVLVVVLAAGVGIVSADKPITAAAGAQGPFAEVKLTAYDAAADAQYGRSVAIDGDLVAVGAGGDGADGAVYVYKRQGMQYVPDAKLVAPDAVIEAEFGRCVVIKGSTLFIGARFAQVGDYTKAGAVYVFRKYQGTWQFEQKISSPMPEDEDNFGRAIAVSGNLMVVTARKNTAEEGAAYLYTYKGGSWAYTATLTASDPVPGAYFGQSVALQGGIMAIGARNADPNAAGALYVFRQTGDGWEEIAKMTPDDGKNDDQFGFSVAMAGDTIAVGARRADLPGASNAGAASLYSVKGDTVTLIAKITANDATKGDEFGQSLAFAGDVLAVGARRADVDGNTDQGIIYFFRRAGNQWEEIGTVSASDGMAGDEFGYSLAAFGNRMVTGAHFADSLTGDNTAGAAYVLPVAA